MMLPGRVRASPRLFPRHDFCDRKEDGTLPTAFRRFRSMRIGWTFGIVLAAGLLLLPGVAFGHAHLMDAAPSQGAVVSTWPETISLRFSEGVELGFSTFKVYPLGVTGDEQTLREAARERLADALRARGDEDVRADVGLAESASPSETVTIRLKETAEPGAYAVMWRALSVDTHVVEGFYVFTYDPEAAE